MSEFSTASSSPPILIWQPEGGVPGGPVSNPPVYSQADVTQLIEGQAYIDVVFGSIQTTEDWVLVACEVENTTDFEPLNIWPGIITDRTAAGFRLQLNGMPDSPNYYLHWAVSGINILPVPATLYQFTGPSSGPYDPLVSEHSSNFTVKLPPSTTLPGIIIVTPDDSGDGGTFSPATVTLSASLTSATFTYTPASYGAKAINVTNSGTLTDPAGITFTALAATYTLSGPSSGDNGVASTNFTVALPVGGGVIGTVTVTPSDGGGGTFTPATVNLSTGAPSATFTYTPASIGAKTISVTNNGGLTNPGNLTYTSTAPAPHLLNTLISYWKLDEASGTRNDTVGTNHLSVFNGPIGTATGKINNAALFVTAFDQHLSIANNSTLQVTGSFTFSMWIKFTTQVLSIPIAKWDGTIDYGVVYNTTTGFEFGVNQAAGGGVARVGSPVANGVWTHLVMWYDAVTGEVYLRVNDTTTYQSTGAPVLIQTSAAFGIGAASDAGGTFPADAAVDEVGFWKRKLTAQEITALYNGGAGLAYSSFTA